MESMTGFGKGYHKGEDFQIFCLAKSLNFRFLEITLKMPKAYMLLEERIKKRVAEEFERGKIEIYFKIYGFLLSKKSLFIDFELAKEILDNLRILKESLKLPGEITVSELLQFKEITLIEDQEEDIDKLWEQINPALEMALKDLKNSRLREGLFLKEKIETYLNAIEERFNEISNLKEKVRDLAAKKLQDRVERLILQFQGSLDEGRLYQELAFLLDKIDISEELDRLKIHLISAKNLLNAPAPGKKLDFLCQELTREITTLSNKAQSAEISLKALEIKELIEKIREQVQNVV